MLITRRTKRDRIIDMQKTLSAMGYLPEQSFDGTVGSATVKAIKAFQAGGFESLVQQALNAAAARSAELAEQLGQ